MQDLLPKFSLLLRIFCFLEYQAKGSNQYYKIPPSPNSLGSNCNSIVLFCLPGTYILHRQLVVGRSRYSSSNWWNCCPVSCLVCVTLQYIGSSSWVWIPVTGSVWIISQRFYNETYLFTTTTQQLTHGHSTEPCQERKIINRTIIEENGSKV